ncbi:MAG: ElaA protein [Patiriisocius sp.]|jgi:ElaA protein
MKILWEIRTFDEFNLEEFHDLIQLRIEVFVIEQDCPYQELDGLDKGAWHITGRDENGQYIACSRVIKGGEVYDQVSFGRVIIKEGFRGLKLGHEVVSRTMDFIKGKFPGEDVKISAQEYLLQFYELHDFVQVGEMYLEDDIPHIPMIYKVEK